MNGLFTLKTIRLISLIHCRYQNFYEALGVSNKATQADIKSAYYKLSMTFHPDRNQGCKEAAIKFQNIRAAYEVLGDYNKRKLYDKGLLVNQEGSFQDVKKKPSHPEVQKRTTVTGRTPIYNFDEWSRAHYGKAFARRSAAKEAYYDEIKRRKHVDQMNRSAAVGVSITLLLVTLAVFSFHFEDYDNPVQNKSDN